MAGSKSKIPLDKLLDVLKAARESDKRQAQPVGIAIHVCDGAPRAVVLAVKEAFLPKMPGATVNVTSSVSSAAPAGFEPDACVIVPGNRDEETRAIARTFARLGIPMAFAVESAVDMPELGLDEESSRLASVIAASNEETLLHKLANWLTGATDKGIAMAASFPFCREEVVSSLITKCAMQNAGIGVVNLVPGSDFPLMTANQMKLALDIAAAHGEQLSPARVAELTGVVGAGFAYRWLARTLISAIPVAGVALKAGMGYAGTMATGRALTARFALRDGSGEMRSPGKGADGSHSDVGGVAQDAAAPALPSTSRERQAGSAGAASDDYIEIRAQ